MTELTTVNGANPHGASVEEVFGGEQLTGEALMLYISTRLNDLDADINELMGLQEEALAKKQLLNDIKAWAQNGDAVHDAYSGDYSGWTEVSGELSEEFPWPPGGTELHELANQVSAEFDDMVSPNMDREQREAAFDMFTKRLDALLGEVDGASELNMIRLQQLMSQRQVALQLTTGILGKFNQGLENIASNLRG